MSRGLGRLQRELVDLLADGRPRSVVELAELLGCERRGVHRAVVGLASRGLVSTSRSRLGLVARVDVAAAPTYLDRLLAEARRRGSDEQASRIIAAGRSGSMSDRYGGRG